MRAARHRARGDTLARRAVPARSLGTALVLASLGALSTAALAVPTAGDWSARPDARLASMPAAPAPAPASAAPGPEATAGAATGAAGNEAAAVVSPVTTLDMPRAASLPATSVPAASLPAASLPAASSPPFAATAASAAASPGLAPRPAPAVAPLPATPPVATVPGLGIGSVLRTLFGLAAVLLAVLACGWLARRLNARGVSSGRLARVVGGVSLGNRERVAVVEIADTWLVLGVTPGGITTLHTLPAGASASRPSGQSDAEVTTTAADGGESTRVERPAGMAQGRPPSFGEALRAQVRDRLQRRRDNA